MPNISRKTWFKKMKALIIGSRGTLGSALSEAFSDLMPVLWDRDDIDITNKEDVLKKISDITPDVVMNAVAYTDVDGAEDNEEIARKVNGYAVGYIAEVAEEIGAIFVQYGTDYVFDGTQKEGYGEKDKPNPISVYGSSKLLGEKEAAKKCRRCYIVRLSRLFGQSEKNNNSKQSFVDLMIALAKNKTELNVVDEEISRPTYAKDAAEKTREIIEKKMPYGIYHAANEGFCTWYGLAEEIFSIKKINVKLNKVPANYFSRKARRPAFSVLLNTKFKPMRPWQEALREYLSNFQ